MGMGIRTVAAKVTNPGATFTAATATAGDSLTVENYTPGSQAFLAEIIREGATAGAVRVLSPNTHDNTRGITFNTDLAVTRMLMAAGKGEPVVRSDQLTVELTGGTNESDLALLTFFYQDAPGYQQTLKQWADISGVIDHIKPITVTVPSGGAADTWLDTNISATEGASGTSGLLKADRWYAVLGFTTDTQTGGIGITGTDTSNRRIAGPGTDFTEDTAWYFKQQADYHGLPWIPLFNSGNAGNTSVSVIGNAVDTGANIQLVCALLAPTFTP